MRNLTDHLNHLYFRVEGAKGVRVELAQVFFTQPNSLRLQRGTKRFHNSLQMNLLSNCLKKEDIQKCPNKLLKAGNGSGQRAIFKSFTPPWSSTRIISLEIKNWLNIWETSLKSRLTLLKLDLRSLGIKNKREKKIVRMQSRVFL